MAISPPGSPTGCGRVRRSWTPTPATILLRNSLSQASQPMYSTALKHLANSRFTSRSVSFEERLRHEPHFLEHPAAVRCDQCGIGGIGEANLEPRRRHEAELLSLR